MTDDKYNIFVKSKKLAIKCTMLKEELLDKESSVSTFMQENAILAGINFQKAAINQNRDEILTRLNQALENVIAVKFCMELLFECNHISENEHGSIYNECLSLENAASELIKYTQTQTRAQNAL